MPPPLDFFAFSSSPPPPLSCPGLLFVLSKTERMLRVMRRQNRTFRLPVFAAFIHHSAWYSNSDASSFMTMDKPVNLL